jgi:hypothetical protein
MSGGSADEIATAKLTVSLPVRRRRRRRVE